ncbi:MAG: maleylacetoacetate isomerase [Betaproteobacteria bacterium]|nr:maleylacetoacetate isomerase [Betaproteobacteria bacterium]
MKLHSYFRSSASFRVRIALAIKGLPYEYQAVHLAKGEQFHAAFKELHGDALVPLLEVHGLCLTQSMAIMEYLDETHPTPALLPADAAGRARVRALSQSIACEIHPINNLRILTYLGDTLKLDENTKITWYRHWVDLGLQGVERQLALQPQHRFCHGDTPTMADCVLVPQIFNAQRYKVELSGFPRILSVFHACMNLLAFQQAQPSACPDFEH